MYVMEHIKPADELRAIAYKMHQGELTYEEAHALAKPIVNDINKRLKEAAKEYGVPFKKMSFTSFTR